MPKSYPKITIRETKDPMVKIAQASPDAFSLMSDHGAYVVPTTPSQEEALVAQEDPVKSSGLYGMARAEFRPHFRAMISRVFNAFNICKREGIDIGSGATGEMVHELLPLTEEERKTWTECEHNPGAIEMHRSLHPESQLRESSYLHLTKSLGLTSTVDTITGLSSLDVTNHLHLAVKEIRDALSIGGYLVHLQDVRPGVHNGINELEHLGLSGQYSLIIGNNGPQVPNNEIPNPFGYVIEDGSNRPIAISSVELLRLSLSRAIYETPGIELVYTTWLEATSEQPQGDQFSEYFECMVTKNPHAREKKAYAAVVVAKRT